MNVDFTELSLKFNVCSVDFIDGRSSQSQSFEVAFVNLFDDKSNCTNRRSPNRFGKCSMQLLLIFSICKLLSDKICESMLHLRILLI